MLLDIFLDSGDVPRYVGSKPVFMREHLQRAGIYTQLKLVLTPSETVSCGDISVNRCHLRSSTTRWNSPDPAS
jgi:hypothetical protein